MKNVLSQRGNSLLVHESFKFRKVFTVKGSEKDCWRYTNKKCKGRLYTLEDGNIISKLVNEHSHDPLTVSVINREAISNSIKRKVDSTDENPSKLVRVEINKNAEAVSYTHLDVYKRQVLHSGVRCQLRVEKM